MADQEASSKKKRSKRNWVCCLSFIVFGLFIMWPFITWFVLKVVGWGLGKIDFPSSSHLGISGDMYGGLNALFAGFAFICFIYALYQQRLELQLQRRELSLQRRELKAQCREQERQANEFELQNKLMKIQQFESFFYQHIAFIKNIPKEVKTNWGDFSSAIDYFIEMLGSFFVDIKNNIKEIESFKFNKDENVACNSLECIAYIVSIILTIRPWIDSTYNFILLVIDEKCLNDKQKEKYLYIIKNMFSEKDWDTIYLSGVILKYDNITNYLLNKGLFEKNDLIERVSEDDMQFLQNEMNLKSNPSLESCEIAV